VSGSWLKEARRQKGWTQQRLAVKLRVSQTYLSLLEQERRPVTPQVLARLERCVEVPATALPLNALNPMDALNPKERHDAQRLAEALGGLGYPGFAHLKGRRLNPAQVLLMALQEPDLETRLTEALPWLLVAYPDMDWDWLTDQAKVHDVQNRLGFLLTLSQKVAQERSGREATALKLATLEQRLERSRLAREDTLCRESMTAAERNWVRHHRSAAAQHWNLLTDLTAEGLDYGD
jgi:transcriptional regulator with XRE-family HTH domain